MNMFLYVMIRAVIATISVTQVSYYGQSFHGNRTASGETYNMHDHTCASPSLPFGTLVLVTNPSNNKSVTVRVNDRGPWKRVNGKLVPHNTRAFDLSQAAFESIADTRVGVVTVNYVVLD